MLGAALALGGCASQKAQAEQQIRAIEKESDAKTLLERGKAFAFVGDQTRAEEYLAAALSAGADPRDVMPLLMEVCVRTGRYRSAIQHGENHLRQHPGDVRTRLMVGALYAAISEPDRARTHLEQVIAKPVPPPEKIHGEAHYLLGVVARDEHDAVAADRHFREYLRIEPHGSHVEEARGSLLQQVPVPKEETEQ
ncbi:MAG: tetratricopeptide repeat protein [Labilithrix sp.]|nr:tetratricopeptide repeat protein [Labilithrix sp.]MCW5815475.1 tetratricopeptide repeat protein [Labilithrix sp.]